MRAASSVNGPIDCKKRLSSGVLTYPSIGFNANSSAVTVPSPSASGSTADLPKREVRYVPPAATPSQSTYGFVHVPSATVSGVQVAPVISGPS